MEAKQATNVYRTLIGWVMLVAIASSIIVWQATSNRPKPWPVITKGMSLTEAQVILAKSKMHTSAGLNNLTAHQSVSSHFCIIDDHQMIILLDDAGTVTDVSFAVAHTGP